MAKDKVGPPGDVLNRRMYVYIDKDSDEQIRLSVKESAWDNAALLTALGWVKTPITGKAVIKETMKEAVQDHGCIPVTIEYVDTDGLGNDKVYTTKTVIAFDKDPQTFKGEVLAGKYHGTLDIVGASIGWSNYPN